MPWLIIMIMNIECELQKFFVHKRLQPPNFICRPTRGNCLKRYSKYSVHKWKLPWRIFSLAVRVARSACRVLQRPCKVASWRETTTNSCSDFCLSAPISSRALWLRSQRCFHDDVSFSNLQIFLDIYKSITKVGFRTRSFKLNLDCLVIIHVAIC